MDTLTTPARLLITRLAAYAPDWHAAPDPAPVYATVREGLPPLEDTVLDQLFSRYAQAEEAEDTAHFHRHTAPWGGEHMEAAAAQAASLLYQDVHHHLTAAGLTGPPLPWLFLPHALEPVAA